MITFNYSFYYYYDFEYDCLILPNDVRKHIENFVNQVGNGDFEKAVNQFVNEQTIENSLAEFKTR